MRCPKIKKFLKEQKGCSINKIAKPFYLSRLQKGLIGLKVLKSGRITAKQLEAFYLCLNKIIKKSGRVILKIFPQTPITKKPIEVRMGKGKGNVELWVSKVTAGSLICEICIQNAGVALKALTIAKQKLPFKTKIV